MQYKKVTIKLNQREVQDILDIYTIAEVPTRSKLWLHLVVIPLDKVYHRLAASEYKVSYRLSLNVSEAAALFLLMHEASIPEGTSMWITQRRLLDTIDQAHTYTHYKTYNHAR